MKNPILSHKDFANRRLVVLADIAPKLIGSEARARMVPHLKKAVTESQWGEGLGAASCEVANLGVKLMGEVARARNLTLVKVHVDVVDAFNSILVNLVLPLRRRDDAAIARLRELGLEDDEIDAVMNADDSFEVSDLPPHVLHMLTSF